MSSSAAKPVAITDGTVRVTGLLCGPPRPLACYVLAHGAGAGMAHPFMAAVATGLAERRIATLRYQFPYMEKGSRRPDPPVLAQATVRAAVAEAARLLPGVPLFAGGKSFGGRMTSQAQAAARLHPRNAIQSTGEHDNFNLCGSFTERQKTIGTDWLMLTSSITDIEAVAWSNALTSVVALLW